MVEISVKKTKLMTNSTSGSIKRSKQMDRGLIVTSFKYLGSVVSDEGSKPEILSRIISLSFKIRLMRSLVTSIFLYACES